MLIVFRSLYLLFLGHCAYCVQITVLIVFRSLCLFRMGEQRLCLADIQLALLAEYPQSLRYKAIVTKSKGLVYTYMYYGRMLLKQMLTSTAVA